jgi:RNA polymerase sigma-70 factor (ECF subfamily)
MDNQNQTQPPAVRPDQWVEQFGDYLYRYALLRLKDPDQAQDVVQETFLAGIKGLEQFSGHMDIKYWLRGILRHKIVDVFRNSKREIGVDDLTAFEQPNKVMMTIWGIPTRHPESWGFDVHRAMTQKEFWIGLKDCVTNLKGITQKAFVLKELEDMGTEEICKVLDINPNYLWVLIYRARKELKSCLKSKSIEPD